MADVTALPICPSCGWGLAGDDGYCHNCEPPVEDYGYELECTHCGGYDLRNRDVACLRGGPGGGSKGGSVLIDTLEGTMQASPGDYVIRGVKGEFYPCKPDIFEATYDPVERGER